MNRKQFTRLALSAACLPALSLLPLSQTAHAEEPTLKDLFKQMTELVDKNGTWAHDKISLRRDGTTGLISDDSSLSYKDHTELYKRTCSTLLADLDPNEIEINVWSKDINPPIYEVEVLTRNDQPSVEYIYSDSVRSTHQKIKFWLIHIQSKEAAEKLATLLKQAILLARKQ